MMKALLALLALALALPGVQALEMKYICDEERGIEVGEYSGKPCSHHPEGQAKNKVLGKEAICGAIINEAAMPAGQSVVCDVEALPGGHIVYLYEGADAESKKSACSSYLLLPGENLWSPIVRGFLYLFTLGYVFLGVAIVADIFMNAIEVITSKEVEVKVLNPTTGKADTQTEKVWNDTIANLSLMALGSSAPEILLSVLGVVGDLDGGKADALGPGTIVGSAAFNLLFITAICVMAPSPKSTSIEQFGVFICTAFFSVEAYLWMFLIIEVISPVEIEVWEAVVTLLHFPLLLGLAYGQDRGWRFGSNHVKVGPEGEIIDEKKGVFSRLKYRREAVRGLTAGKRIINAVVGGGVKDEESAVELKSDPNVLTSDPYCVLRVGNRVYKTQWLKKNCNPAWNQNFSFAGVSDTDTLLIEVYDHDELSADDFMGQAKVSLTGLETDKAMDMWIDLLSHSNQPGGRGKVHLVLTMTADVAENHLRVDVVEAKDLIGLERSNKYIDAMAASVGSRIRLVRGKMAYHLEIWDQMKVDWFDQFNTALTACGDKDEDGNDLPPSSFDLTMHFFTIFWKAIFAFVPPANYYGGWLAFVVAIIMIGAVTFVVGEIAGLFGCVVGLKDEITAITFVALGTSLPDTFASRSAATHEEVADAAIGNVTGSNGVNVFLGIGIPWTIATVYGALSYSGSGCPAFVANSDGFGLSVMVYCVCATICLLVLYYRRLTCGGELGGDYDVAKRHATLFFGLWFVYIMVSALQYSEYFEVNMRADWDSDLLYHTYDKDDPSTGILTCRESNTPPAPPPSFPSPPYMPGPPFPPPS